MSKQNEKKEKSIELMKKLEIYKPYIDAFNKENRVCFFEGFGGFYVDQEKEIYNKMKELEEKYSMKVYAITHEYTGFGECWDFLIVTDYEEEWDSLIYDNGNHEFNAFAYVWNKDYDDCSEFGDVVVKSALGGIKRVA